MNELRVQFAELFETDNFTLCRRRRPLLDGLDFFRPDKELSAGDNVANVSTPSYTLQRNIS
jgi:hypothetical protein